MSSIKSTQGRLGVPVTGEWDSTTEGAAVAYQGSGDGFLPMNASAHMDPPTLINLGYYNPLEELPEPLSEYLAGGKTPSTLLRDVGTAVNQIPRWGWAVGCVGFCLLSYSSYTRGRKPSKRGS